MAEFVTCSQDSVVFWDYKSFTLKSSTQPFSGSGYHIQSANWSTSNSKLMVAPKWGDCIAWCEPTINSSEWNTIWHKDSGHFTCGCLMSNSRYLLTGVSDGCLMLWDIKNKNPTKTFEAHTSPVTGIVSSYNDQLVLSGGQEGKLLLHSLTPSHTLQNTVVLTHSDTVSQGAITRVRFSVMDRAMVASAGECGVVCLWSVESQRMLHHFTSSGPTTDLCFAQSNNKLLVSVGHDCKIHFLDIQQRKEVMLVSTPSSLSSVAILRDGYTVAAGGVDGKLYVFELRAMKSPKHVLEAHQGEAITCIAEQNAVKSSRSSMKRSSLKKAGKESSGLSSLPSTDSPVMHDSPTIQQDYIPDTTTVPGHVLATPEDLPPPPHVSQLPTLSIASHIHVTTSGSDGIPTVSVPNQTPYPVTRSTVQWAQFTTPAAQQINDKDSTGIFSPVDSTLSTPHLNSGNESGGSSCNKPPNDIPASLRHRPPPSGGSGPSMDTTRYQYPLMSTFVSSTPAMQQPPLGMSGVFSPLDAPTPASIPGVVVTGAPGMGGRWHHGLHNAPTATPSAASTTHNTVSLIRPPINIATEQSDGGFPSNVPHTTTPTNTAPSLPQTSPPSLSTENKDYQKPHTNIITSVDSMLAESQTTLPTRTKATTQEPSTQSHSHVHPHPIPSSSSTTTTTAFITPPITDTASNTVHLQYFEKLVHDSNEELRYAMRKDMLALGVDMFRQFHILKQQFGTAMSVLHEKIDRLSEENKHLQEQLHQYAPKY